MELVETLTREVVQFLHENMDRYGYPLLFLITFLETSAFLGLVSPGETGVVVGGLFASRGPLDLDLVILVSVVGAFLGDNTGYWLGRRFGTGILERYGKYVLFNRKALEHVRRYYARH